MAKYFNFFTEDNNFTVDDFGNIGQTMPHGTFNTNKIGTNTNTTQIIGIEANQKYFYDNVKPLEVYYLGNNILKLLGQPIPRYTIKQGN